MMNAETGSLYLFQISQLKGPTARVEKIDPFSTENMFNAFRMDLPLSIARGCAPSQRCILEMTQIGGGKRHARPKNVALAVATRLPRHLRGLESGMQAWIRESTRHDIGGRVRHKLGS